jgi:demethylmenaquinone methyltransferase/2-methoxy-6-polyprenyl-1,4-benzoquinol methylase
MSKIKPEPCYTTENQTQIVQGIFSSISRHYDFLNHFLSFGQDILWRKKAITRMQFGKTYRCLDVATGTGDVAIAIAKKNPEVSIMGVDFSQAMIDQANKKILNKPNLAKIVFELGDATSLSFPDNSFDVAIISFGIRNIPDKLKALQEMTRVVIPGGQVMILEMVSQQNRWFQTIYQYYLCYLLPFFASFFSSNRKAYQYLSNSILNFPSIQEFCDLMSQSGLAIEQNISMTFGITRLFIGKKEKDCPLT